MNTNQKFYQQDLAFVHDSDFSQIGIDAGKYLAEHLKEQGIENGLIVDLGCGTGVFAKTVSAYNYDVLGIDYSAANIDLARQNAPQAHFQVDSFLDVDLPKAQAFTAIGEVFNYLFDEDNNLEMLTALFQKIYEQLLPNGVLMFDVLAPDIIGDELITKSIVETEEWTIFITKEGNLEKKTLTRDIILFRKIGDCYRKSHEFHRVLLLSPKEIQEALENIGFSVEMLNRYGDFEFRHGLFGIFARKIPSFSNE
jgi:SAM-dependent methyltransferase